MKTLNAVLLFALVIGCGQKDNSRNNATSGAVASNVAKVAKVEKRSDLAPNFSWKDSTGKDIDFDSFKGRVTLVNFWATWCGPCRRELPDLIALSNEMAARGVKIIGISTDRGGNAVDDVGSFVSKQGIPYQIVISNSDLEEAFGTIQAIPTSFVIDKQGKIVQKIIGMRSKDAFAQAITPLLN